MPIALKSNRLKSQLLFGKKMDTLDKAAALANPKLADATNKDWLLLSARSSQLSANDYHRRDQFVDWSSNSLPSNGNLSQRELNGSNRLVANESSWLLRHYTNNRLKGDNNNNKRRTKDLSNYAILYDNISFADSLISRKTSLVPNDSDNNLLRHESTDQQRGEQFEAASSGGKFRIFLASYLLLGVTLAIYSRNALSLAAVGMVANNQVDRRLVDYLALSSSNGTSDLAAKVKGSLDGSCPVDKVWQRPKSVAEQRSQVAQLKSELEAAGLSMNTSKEQLEIVFKASIRRRIEAGELVDWTPSEQGLIFAAGSVGNLLIAIPLTRMGEIHGPKWIVFAALLGATLQAALMPVVSPMNVTLVILFQVIFNGLTFGADCVAYTLFAHWLTPTEMAFFVACLLICYQLGTIISSFVTAKILSLAISWSWCFYAPAILCGIWVLIWAIIGASEPSKSWLISAEELDYLMSHSKIAQAARNGDEDLGCSEKNANKKEGSTQSNQTTKHNSVSWLKLAKDPNIWAIIAVKFTLRWYFSVYASLMPTYLSSVAHMSVETIGQVSVFQCLIGLLSGLLMSYLTKSIVLKRPFNLSLAAFRKTFQSVVNFGLAISLLIFISFDCIQWVTIVTLTVSGICINFYVAAALQLPLDLSPEHCGLITSVSNTLALGQALGAPISGLVLNNGPRERSLWRVVWGMAIVLNILSGLLFILLVDTKPRDYNKDFGDDKEKSEYQQLDD